MSELKHRDTETQSKPFLPDLWAAWRRGEIRVNQRQEALLKAWTLFLVHQPAGGESIRMQIPELLGQLFVFASVPDEIDQETRVYKEEAA